MSHNGGSSEPMTTSAGKSAEPVDWRAIESKMRVVRLTPLVQVLVPALLLPSLSKSTRGLTLYPGRPGIALGAVLLACSALIGALLLGPTGVWGAALSFWTLGTAGAATVAGALRPTAFVKPICVRCRLLPVIKEHEALHLSGIASEDSVWASMKSRHSVVSLSLEGDPAICSFCPIPRRLAAH